MVSPPLLPDQVAGDLAVCVAVIFIPIRFRWPAEARHEGPVTLDDFCPLLFTEVANTLPAKPQ
jgi:hypothetical protein